MPLLYKSCIGNLAKSIQGKSVMTDLATWGQQKKHILLIFKFI